MVADNILIELLPEASQWVSQLTPGSLKEAVERGAAYLLAPAEYPLDDELRDDAGYRPVLRGRMWAGQPGSCRPRSGPRRPASWSGGRCQDGPYA